VIERMCIVSFSGIVARQNHVSSRPEISFTDPLEEKVKIKAFPIGPDAEAILIAGCGVSDYGAIARVSNGIGTEIDHSVSIKILKTHVTRAELKIARLQYLLRSDTWRHYISFAVI